MRIFKNILIATLLIMVCALTYTVISANSKVDAAEKLIQTLKQQKKEQKLSGSDGGSVKQGEDKLIHFVEAAFNYSSQKDNRYEQAKPYTTQNGLQSMIPSSANGEVPKLPNDVVVTSKATNFDVYFRPNTSGTGGKGIIMFDITVDVNGNASTSRVMLACKLIYDEKQQTYLVDDTQVITQTEGTQ
ncbi:hypothetical protein BIV60_11975 [Bacillus sp. MUM 116]|uniref:hypothetical protein n=1 Tax=Bacillus sp. MUM 116 TaxID=1678002 RepID=UPI0008F5F72E|nr:hypothetical protein [Bacillus sp. MUM 116]OIK14220.1 hypothetical protein BIV60_11975 [Bacillus sp. MUM 116]